MKKIFIIAIIMLLAFNKISYPQTNSQTINLKPGFNFVSFTVSPTNTPAEIKQNYSTLIDDIYLYSAAAGSFLSLSEGSLSSVSAGKGYIFKSKAEGSVTVSGISVSSIADVSLKAGFNLIGVSSAVNSVTFLDLMKNYSVIKGLYKWSTAAGSFIQVIADKNNTPQILDGVNPKFNLGESYFINVDSDLLLSFTGGEISFTGSSIPVKTSNPVITPSSGTYTATQIVTIDCATSGATIKYTTDGSDPSSTNGITYLNAFNISSTTTVKAIAIKTGMTDSTIISATYTINITPPLSQTLTIDLGGGVLLEMVKITAAGKSFQMGSPDNEQDHHSTEGPVHTVSFTKDYYIGKYEVTQAQWLKICGAWPETAPSSLYGIGNDYPAYNISWDDIHSTGGFLDKINILKPNNLSGFRLPTEAEWEYAARGNTQTRFYWGDDPSYSLSDKYEWYAINSGLKTHPVGQKLPNPFGLYDTLGNVCEWCSDWYDNYNSLAITDPIGPSSGSYRIIRGGVFGDEAKFLRVANRCSNSSSDRIPGLGFRIALGLNQLVIINSEITPKTLTFDKSLSTQSDISVTIIPNGNTLAAIKYGAKLLIEGTDFNISGNTIILKKSFFENQPSGNMELTIKFSAGNDQILTIKVLGLANTSGKTLTLDLGGGVLLEMIKISAAEQSFKMGSPDTELDRYFNEGPVHTVSFTRDYYIGKYEVTQAQWEAIMGSNNLSYLKTGDNYPVYYISWYDICNAGGFLEKINTLSPNGFSNFRLPTEAEWEYAARGNTQTRFYWGDDLSYNDVGNYAWYISNSESKIQPVGQKLPNPFGLYDMSGNVNEWCSDWYGTYGNSSVIDPIGPALATEKVVRSSGWDNDKACRSAARSSTYPSSQGKIGFRLALTANYNGI